jgi:hypothetical protein
MIRLLPKFASGINTLESLDDKGASGGNEGDGCLSVLDRKLDSDPESLPGTRGLGYIFTNFFRVLNVR